MTEFVASLPDGGRIIHGDEDQMAKKASKVRGKAWLTVEEIAVRMRVSERTLYRAIAADTFPAVRIGRRICIPAAAHDELAKAAFKSGATVDAADWRDVLMKG